MRYKKRYKIVQKAVSKESINNLAKWAKLIHLLEQNDFELMYFDEFSINERSFTYKGWSNKGIKGLISKTDQNLTFSVAVWFSKKMIYGVMATWKTFNSQAIKHFYHGWMEARQKLELDQQDLAILVGDNSKIHK